MEYKLSPIDGDDREAVIDIFNHYVDNSFAAYPETNLPYEAFDKLLDMSRGYPTIAARDEAGSVLGFGMLRPYSPIPAFAHTAEISYFVRPDCRGRGVGSAMLQYLLTQARQQGITSILAGISSRNEPSIAFHGKHGFQQVGRFREIGIKRDEVFDVVWMQKML